MRSIIKYIGLLVTVMALRTETQASKVSDYGTMQRYPWHKQEERTRNRPSNLLTLKDFLRNYAAGQHVGARTRKTEHHIEGKEDHREGMKVSEMGEESVYQAREEGGNRRKEATEELQTMDRNNFRTSMFVDHREDELRSPDIEWRDSTDYSADFRSSGRPIHESSVEDEKHLIDSENPIESLKYIINSLKEVTSQDDSGIRLDAEDTNTTLRNNILKGIEMGIGYLKSGFRGVLMESDRLLDDYLGNGSRNKRFNSDTNTHLRANKKIYVYDREGYVFRYPPYEETGQDDKMRDARHVVKRMDTDIDGSHGSEQEQPDYMEVRTLGDNTEDEDTWNATSERSKSSSDYDDLSLDCLLSPSECDDQDDLDNSSYDVAEVRKHKKKKKKFLKKILMPLLISYKLKFFALIPVLVSGLVLLVGSTGLAGFFLALFAAVLSIKQPHQS